MLFQQSRKVLCALHPIFVVNGVVTYKLNVAAKHLSLNLTSRSPLSERTIPSGAAPVLELTYPTSSTSSAKPQTKAHANPQMLMLHFPATGQRAAVFPEGSIVGFGFRTDRDLETVREAMRPFEDHKDPLMIPDGVVSIGSQRYSVPSSSATGETAGAAASSLPSFAVDPVTGAIVLPSDNAKTLAPCAMCLVELVQLRTLSTLLAPIARDTSAWRDVVKAGGSLPLSLQQARKRKAEVMRIRSRQMKIASARQHAFWDSHHAESRLAFTLACEHFELATAHNELRERVDAVAQTLVYLSEEAHADTHHQLEWVIIVLISMEVMISLMNHH